MIPVFIFTILAFIYLLQILVFHNNFQEAITNIGLDSAKYGYLYESIEDSLNSSTSNLNYNNEDGVIDSKIETLIAKSIDSIYFKTVLTKKLNIEALNKSIIKNGLNGVHTFLSSYMEEDDEVDIILNYNIKLPLAFINLDDFHIVQRVKLRSWTGYRPAPKFAVVANNEEDQNEEMVYIAETGNVYHTSNNCSHIRLSIRNAPYNQVKDLRNKSGGKYSRCNICWSSNEAVNSVYITTSGDRYHSNKNCSGLKRTVTEVSISQVSGRSLCKRCGK